ncbi:MAG: hypothetical protein K0S28_2442 [Paucimonas sp.]|nr:hypothetical protein [Paucimonas sp.]
MLPAGAFGLLNGGVIAGFALVQFLWLHFLAGPRIALINLYPAIFLIAVWTLFVTTYYADRILVRNLLLLPVLVLCLRLQVTWFQGMQVLNWAMCLVMVAAVAYRFARIFDTRVGKIFLLLAGVVVLTNAAHHTGLDSPYTYTFRVLNEQPSGYTGVDNNSTWECAYERPQYPVHCDARHFVASERIFTEADFDPSYSVLLQRFLHGYVNSLAGMEGTRWWVNLGVNFTFWFFACVCVYRISRLLKQSENTSGMAMLCCASGLGFIDMFAQPSPYLMAYAYAPIVIWATLEMIFREPDRVRTTLFVLIISSVVMVYDAYQLILVSVLLLLINKKRFEAGAVFLLPLVFTLLWKYFSLDMVLGTRGEISNDTSTGSLLKLDVESWLLIVKLLNFPQFAQFAGNGILTYLYGNVIIGALAAWGYLFISGRKGWDVPEQKNLLVLLFTFNLLMMAAMIFVAPHMMLLSPSSGMQPRMAFYTYPINMIALAILASRWLRQYAWIMPLMLLIVANINLSGWASLDMLFDYGRIGMFWK